MIGVATFEGGTMMVVHAFYASFGIGSARAVRAIAILVTLYALMGVHVARVTAGDASAIRILVASDARARSGMTDRSRTLTVVVH